MTVEVNLALIIAVLSITATIVTTLGVFFKMKFTQQHHDEELKKQANDINLIGKKVESIRLEQAADLKDVGSKVNEIEKTLVQITAKLQYITETMDDIKGKVNR